MQANTPIGKTVPYIEKYRRLMEVVDSKDTLAILINADPDALASAMALKRLFWRKAKSIGIYRINKIERADNLAFISLLNIKHQHIHKLRKSGINKWALVDSQPDHNAAFDGYPFDIIIDHHPLSDRSKAPFMDIRPEIGANATLMTEYLKAAKIKPSPRLATALFYGIKTDTDNFLRGSASVDVAAFRYLYQYANLNIVKKIESSEITQKTLDDIVTAVNKMTFIKQTAFTHMDVVQSADTLVIIADFFLKLAEVSWSVCSGIEKNKLVVIFRNAGFRRDAGKWARESFGDVGSAGGHKSAARAEVSLDKIVSGKNDQIAEVRKFVRERLQRVAKYLT